MLSLPSPPWRLGSAWRNPLLAKPSAQQPLKVAILGSTGSIGTQTLAVMEFFRDRFQVIGLSAGQQVDLLTTQTNQWQPNVVCLQHAKGLVQALQGISTPSTGLEGLWGDYGLLQLATHPDVDVVIVGLVGLTGLAPTLAALKAGKRVITANKETFVAGGHLVEPYLDQLLPIDSEHAAIFQCLQGVLQEGDTPTLDSVAELILTASGGPFRTWDAKAIQTATREQALAHPNWVMGSKVTVDSATLMNKGLELIEAHWLFGLPYERINVVIHPQSMAHSGVRFVDGSVLTQWGTPDMRVPIVHALAYPHRWPLPNTGPTEGTFATSHYPPSQWQNLTFETPDLEKFPALALARHAGEQGPANTIALNAADEVAVERFLQGELAFGDIVPCVAATLAALRDTEAPSNLAAVTELDTWARQQARAFTPKISSPC